MSETICTFDEPFCARYDLDCDKCAYAAEYVEDCSECQFCSREGVEANDGNQA